MRKHSFFSFFCNELLILAEKHESICSGVEKVYLLLSFRGNTLLGFINGTGVEGSREGK